MEECGKNEAFEIKISRKQAHEMITQYYKKYQNFNGEIKFRLYHIYRPDGWGFYDGYGRIDL